jgi:hypothetical protein
MKFDWRDHQPIKPGEPYRELKKGKVVCYEKLTHRPKLSSAQQRLLDQLKPGQVTELLKPNPSTLKALERAGLVRYCYFGRKCSVERLVLVDFEGIPCVVT